MKMLDSAAFYTPSGNSPAVFLVYFWHSCYIPSTLEMHSRYSSCILFAFLDARTAFGSHSVSILTAFEQQSRHLPAGVIRTAIELQSYGIRLAFWTFWQHSKYSYWVPTTFELHSRANTLGMCKNHSMWVRGEFWVFERHSYKKRTIPPECDSNFENFHSGWFRLIPFPCDGGFNVATKTGSSASEYAATVNAAIKLYTVNKKSTTQSTR